MTNDELEKLLKSARLPEQKPGYGEAFSKKAAAAAIKTAQVRAPETRPSISRGWSAFAWSSAVAAACILVASVLHFSLTSKKLPPPADASLAAARKCFRELESLFPRQVEGLVFGANGPRMELAETPTVPDSPPIYLTIHDRNERESFVTFSGQEIQVRGKQYEVLAGDDGHVFLVGGKNILSANDPTSALRVEARPLEGAM
jgi:hypothetical protein